MSRPERDHDEAVSVERRPGERGAVVTEGRSDDLDAMAEALDLERPWPHGACMNPNPPLHDSA